MTPKVAAASASAPAATTIILDNGAYTAKVGAIGNSDPYVIPNCIMKAKAERRRAFIGNQLDECRDASGLFYILGFQKGYLTNWDTQKTVWDHIFSSEGTGLRLDDNNIIITEPQMNFASIQEAMMEILFEEYHCTGVFKTTTADLAVIQYASEQEIKVKPNTTNTNLPITNATCVVVDAGYSFTHIVPFIRGRKINKGTRRIEVGGKILTNYLKELISYRHLNVMDESYVVNQIKEDVCFVSKDFNVDMQMHTNSDKRKKIVVDYVLPDFSAVKRGYIRPIDAVKPKLPDSQQNDDDDQQWVRLGNERFTVPELLFHPSDVGIRQVGIPEAIMDAIKDCPVYSHAELLNNILLIGGSSLFPNFQTRLSADVQALSMDDYHVRVIKPENPIQYGWWGGRTLAKTPSFSELCFKREDYEENGYIVGC